MSTKGKCIYPNLRWFPKNKTSANKYFTINCLHLTHRACQILSTFTNTITVSIFTVSAFIFLTLTPHIPILFTDFPQQIIIIFISVINQLDAQNFCFTISLFHASTCFKHMCSSSGGQNCIWYHTYRCDDTRGCVMQFWPPDDKHMCSEHVEAWNKLILKQKFVHQVG